MDPANFTEPKAIRYHWGGQWVEIQSLSYKYNGGEHVDKITMPNLTLEGVLKMLMVTTNFHHMGWWRLYGLDGTTRTLIRNEKDLFVWWTTTHPDDEGHSHLYVEFHEGHAGNAIWPLDDSMDDDATFPEGSSHPFEPHH